MTSEVAKSASGSVKVLASGEVYRQKFDAEVQLVRAYEASEERRKTRENTMAPPIGLSSENSGIPLVRLSRHGPGLLDHRQKSWMQSLPYDSSQENPVLYRFSTAEEKKIAKISVEDKLRQEILSLPDVVTPAKIGSNIVERIGQSRQKRHESTLEEMKQEIGLINTSLEPIIQAACEELMAKLQDNDKLIDEMINQLDSDEFLAASSKDEIEQIWVNVAQQSNLRIRLILDLDATLSKLEEGRVFNVREIFQKFADQLDRISHLGKPDLERLLDSESQMFNQCCLSNKRAYADLHARLLLADAEREKRLRTQWRRRQHDWKKLMTDKAMKEFNEYMESEYVTDPPHVRDIMTSWKAEQLALNKKRLDLIETLNSFGPPASTKTAVIKWNQQMRDITTKINNLNREYFQTLHKEYEKICQDCIAESERLKEDLMNIGASSKSGADELAREMFLPVIGDLQTKYEQHLAEMDTHLERHEEYTARQLRVLFKFCQGGAHCWDVHEIGLARCERALQEKLDESRNKHDGDNQDREANLDISMDRMRQDASETALKDSLTKVLEMLEKIKESYFKFHGDQLNLVDTYPDMVADEVNRYDDVLCRYFNITRDDPDPPETEEDMGEDATTPGGTSTRPFSKRSKDSIKIKEKTGKLHKFGGEGGGGGGTAGNTAHNLESTTTESIETTSTRAQVLETTKGTKFYVLTVEPPMPDRPDPIPDIQDSEAALDARSIETLGVGRITPKPSVVNLPDFLENCNVPPVLINQIKRQIRLVMLDHLEDWTIKAIDRARTVVTAKKEELNSELDLRLHLHEPRARRAEIDVHNVRAAELVLHSERVSRHCKGVLKTLQDLKQQFTELTQDHNRRAVAYRKEIEGLETIFVNATKSASIIKLTTQLGFDQEKYMDGIRESLRKFRSHLEASLAGLRDANAKFIKSFKVFSDGGNFCPEELEEYRKKLDRMATRIDTTEGSILGELEGMESKRLEQAMRITQEFEERFKHHLVDLVFMEKIARWLTNVQVKIKAEVAGSNTEAGAITEFINTMETYIDAIEKPAADKPSITPKQLYDSLNHLFDMLDKRADYLEVKKEDNPPPVASQGKVNFSGPEGTGVMTLGARGDKNKVDDPSVGVIRNILKFVKTSKHELARRTALRINRNLFSKGKGIEKKYFIFGEYPLPNEENVFKGRVMALMRSALDGLLASAELYYRQKGGRQVTRPQVIQDCFETCADTVVLKLQSYFKQTEHYHNECLQEFRGQLERLEVLSERIPVIMMKEFSNGFIKLLDDEQNKREDTFAGIIKASDKAKKRLMNDLRPGVGHPNAADEMNKIMTEEQHRGTALMQAMDEYSKGTLERLVECGHDYLMKAGKLMEEVMSRFDTMLTVDDVHKGQKPKPKYPTSELLRRHLANQPLEDVELPEMIDRSSKLWDGLIRTELTVPGIPLPPMETASKTEGKGRKKVTKRDTQAKTHTPAIGASKTTLAHYGAYKGRQQVYLEFRQYFKSIVERVEDTKQRQFKTEDEWNISWTNSVEKLKELY